MIGYRYSYQTIVRYSTPVSHHHFMLRAVPLELAQQRILESALHLLSPAEVSYDNDAFGNKIQYGSINERHDMFVVASNGVVECDRYMIAEAKPLPIFLVQTKLTICDENIAHFGASTPKEGTPLEQALALSEHIYLNIKYTPGVTSVYSSAADCLKLKQGVCQDYAHLLLSLCRERAIYARYVVGFVVGTGETHAWVEVYSDGVWYGVDPTHNLLIEYGYIKVAHGRDASDCSVTRGVHRGKSSQRTEVNVVVEQV